MKIWNAKAPEIIATLKHYEQVMHKKEALLYFDEKDKKFKMLDCWVFQTNKKAKTQIKQFINLGKCQMNKDIVKSIVELFADKLDLKEVIVTAESHDECYKCSSIFDLRYEFSFKIKKDNNET